MQLWGMHRAAGLSVLAISVLATDKNDISLRETPPTATSLLENARENNGNSNSNRPFFIQDPNDGLCLSGGTFKRCAVDTLWKVEGEPGRHSVRRLAVLDDGEKNAAHPDRGSLQRGQVLAYRGIGRSRLIVLCLHVLEVCRRFELVSHVRKIVMRVRHTRGSTWLTLQHSSIQQAVQTSL